jgi:hypothetical protein
MIPLFKISHLNFHGILFPSAKKIKESSGYDIPSHVFLYLHFECYVTPQLHRAIGDWSVVFLAKLLSEPMTTYLTPISPIGHLFSTYQLLLEKDKFHRWKITDCDFKTCLKFSIGENILQITDSNRYHEISKLLITDIADRTKITKYESPAISDGKCLTTDD